MNIINQIHRNVPVATILKCCPFCDCRALLTQDAEQLKFGVRCYGCRAGLLEVFETPES